jgi:hypothetical protein
MFLTLDEQMALVDPPNYDPGRLSVALCRLALSTGIHPVVWSRPNEYALRLSSQYLDYSRPKTLKKITVPWSCAMKDPWVLPVLAKVVGRTPEYYAEIVSQRAHEVGITDRTAFLRLRHSHIVDLARLGYDPFTISHRTGTSLSSIGRHYTVGMAEAKRLTEEEKGYLTWLIEP